MKVSVASGGTWHSPHTAFQLHSGDMLDKLITPTPLYRIRRRAQIPRDNFTRLSRFTIRSATRAKESLGYKEGVGRAIAAGDKRYDVAIVYSHFAVEMLRRNQRPMVVVDRASLHTQDEWRIQGVEPSGAIAEIIARENQEYKLCDYVLVPSEQCSHSLVATGVDRSKIKVIALGVDTARFAPGREPFSGLKIRVCAVGRLSPQKGIDGLLSAFSLLPANRFELHLIGELDVSLRESLVELQKSHHVEFHGRLPQSKVAQYLREMNVICLPSKFEGMSLAVAEALASGAAAVVSKRAGYEASNAVTILDDVTPSCIAGALTEYGRLSRNARHDVWLAARQAADLLSWDSYGRALRTWLREIRS